MGNAAEKAPGFSLRIQVPERKASLPGRPTLFNQEMRP